MFKLTATVDKEAIADYIYEKRSASGLGLNVSYVASLYYNIVTSILYS